MNEETEHVTGGSSVDVEGYADEAGEPYIKLTFTHNSRIGLLFPLWSARVLRDALTAAIDATEAGMAAELKEQADGR